MDGAVETHAAGDAQGKGQQGEQSGEAERGVRGAAGWSTGPVSTLVWPSPVPDECSPPKRLVPSY